jgi:glycosyltransferase involved in cell wall biosynthesis
MTQPLVSVVVPTHSRSSMLLRCLAALAAQDYAPFEVVVVDDGSTDDTRDRLARFAHDHPGLRLTVLHNAPQIGANPSRKRGIEASRGSLVAFEDDDCIADASWLSALVRGFTSERVGAVTGIVEDPAPKNIYDLAFRGTHRVHGRLHATRLVAGNMCVRRDLLEGTLDGDRAEVSADLSVSGRGDEEDLFLKLKSRGYLVVVAHDAKVLHVHYYSRRSFYRQALRGGASSAKLGYKYYLPPRIELLCLAGGYVFAAGALVSPWCLLPSAACFGLFTAGALVYNEIARKRKTVRETLVSTPVMAIYYHVRTYGYLRQYARLWLGLDTLPRVRLQQEPQPRG